MNLILARLSRWKALILLNALYAAAGLLWIILIPYNNAPDENTHFHYSVEFIIQHHRLPVWGVDDIERFRYALSSYNQMPALNYVLYAVGATLANKLFGLETYIGARLVSLGWGLVFLNFLFLAVRELCGNQKNALIVSATIALIPQVFFSFCYINGDAHSLATAAILSFALMRLLRDHSPQSIIFAGAAIGLLFSAKYNYYLYFPCIAVFLLLAVVQRIISWKTIGRLIIASTVLSLIISGYWFIRNAILYGNPIPILLSEDFFRSIALAREVHPVNRGINIPALIWLVQNGFIGTTFDSFFAVFGYLNVGFHHGIYIILHLVVPLITFLFILDLILTKDRLARIMLGWLLLLILAVTAMHVWACLTYDYQPQGRYYFTVLTPIALYAGWAVTRHVVLKKYVVSFLIVMAGLFIGANLLIIRTYGPPVEFTVSRAGTDQAVGPLKSAFQQAKKIEKNYYSTGNISLGNEPAAFLRIDLPKDFLARYRDFKIEFITSDGSATNDWNSTPPEQMVDVKFDKNLTAFEACGPDAHFILPLKDKASGANSVKITCRMEHRRLYDLGK